MVLSTHVMGHVFGCVLTFLVYCARSKNKKHEDVLGSAQNFLEDKSDYRFHTRNYLIQVVYSLAEDT
jgi:hypothetical protein